VKERLRPNPTGDSVRQGRPNRGAESDRLLGRVSPVFGRDNPILTAADLDDLLQKIPAGLEIEIGCGNGHFLVAYAQRRPDRFLIGIEQKMKRCAKAAKKIGGAGLTRAVVVCARAEEVIGALPPATVQAFHLYFPDPWPKGRHRRRRFLRKPNLETLIRALKPEGRLFFVTDFFDYAVQAKVLMLMQDGLEVRDEAPPQECLISVFGQRFVEWRKGIHFVTGVRASATSGSLP
jgi:tRNA (guanine-N(7)-)-methyltransferase